MAFLSQKPTGRDWGNKIPFKVIRQFRNRQGIKCAEVEADSWEGPTEPGERGQYIRSIWIEEAGQYYDPLRSRCEDKIGPGKEFLPRRPTTCSFESELAKAVK